MKLLQLLIVLVCICFCLFAQNKERKNTGKYQNDLETEGLHGKVKSYTTYIYTLKNQILNEHAGWDYSSKIAFNKVGNITDMYSYNDFKTGRMVNYIQCVYDRDGRKTSMVRDGGTVMSRSEFSYNHKGNLVEISRSNTRVSFRFVYNNFGKRDTMYAYDRAGKLNSKAIYRYNSNRYLVEEVRYKADGSKERRQLYQYDSRGNKVQEIWYDSGKVVTGRIDYKYDSRNNQISALDSNVLYIGGPPAKNLGNSRNLRILRYDDIDKEGNWLSQSLMIDDKVVRITKREINYY